jgi:hypothetical protein
MINPSIHGWIDKFFLDNESGNDVPTGNSGTFYENVRKTGFIYGHIISFYTTEDINTKGWLSDETSKLALLIILYRLYIEIRHDDDRDKFISETIAFYDEMNPKGFTLFKKMLSGRVSSTNLEKIIDSRVQTNDNIVSKNFSHIVTNALLFIDVLAYQKYLEQGAIPEKYLKKTEEIIVSIVTLALRTKSKKSQYDDLLIKLFESSVRYSKFSEVSVQSLELLPLDYFTDALEKYYLLDLAGMALWSDGILENEESYFLYKLAEMMHVTDAFVAESIKATNDFIATYKKEIPYFNFSNPVKHFYDHITESVVVLITRNKNRLVREIMQSGELVRLLASSAKRDLDEKEKKKVRKQLLDICKTIPSLTIFLLPGGSLLLPILIKFIPQLLPSAFNENSDQL